MSIVIKIYFNKSLQTLFIPPRRFPLGDFRLYESERHHNVDVTVFIFVTLYVHFWGIINHVMYLYREN